MGRNCCRVCEISLDPSGDQPDDTVSFSDRLAEEEDGLEGDVLYSGEKSRRRRRRYLGMKREANKLAAKKPSSASEPEDEGRPPWQTISIYVARQVIGQERTDNRLRKRQQDGKTPPVRPCRSYALRGG
ncbi:MAG: hypothetical protein ABIJ46_00850 [bacterium]